MALSEISATMTIIISGWGRENGEFQEKVKKFGVRVLRKVTLNSNFIILVLFIVYWSAICVD